MRLVRLMHARRIARDRFRLTLDLIDPDRAAWGSGDCTVRVDVLDAPRHDAVPRGLLKSAFELFQLSPDSPPAASDARLL